jgi:diaminohydroxyphosphoribosylaminopyrimidine deaminase/5-amino-6-(5-phosphoribosylamino)uracil reductase
MVKILQVGHELFMKRAMELALLGGKDVKSNPLVGCVITNKGRIIGEGYHKRFGEAHAEVNAINVAIQNGEIIDSDCIFYVTLEPCGHQGKTPPCADLIATYRPEKVFFGAYDIHPVTKGKGLEKLASSGISYEHLPVSNIDKLIKPFLINHFQERPYVIAKWAQTLDGIIGNTQERLFITDESTNRLVHKWRTEVDAILVGGNTLEYDDPQLNVRLVPGSSPLRIILSSRSKTFFAGKKINSLSGETLYLSPNDFKNSSGQFDWNLLLRFMYKELNICKLLVEGGSITLQSLLDSGNWDEVRKIVNTNKSLSGDILAPQLKFGSTKSINLSKNDKLYRFINPSV